MIKIRLGTDNQYIVIDVLEDGEFEIGTIRPFLGNCELNITDSDHFLFIEDVETILNIMRTKTK